MSRPSQVIVSSHPTQQRAWPKRPLIFEINTWVWLTDLGRKYRRHITLGNIPEQEWDVIASYGFDAVWLMGVWERSPAGISISMRNAELLKAFKNALPDFSAADNVGSPYCIRRYTVDEHLGGDRGLAMARKMLRDRGMKLILDFAPNHVAPDHPWATAHPEYFIRGSMDDIAKEPSSFIELNGNVYACGRDPYFPAWPDVLQLNGFQPSLRHEVIETLNGIAAQCDGVRCDMAMLMLNSIFERTWGARAGARPPHEYWVSVIRAVKENHRSFLFIAEAYWDLEWELQQQGFDFCYDKKLYDRLECGDAESVRSHLLADLSYQNKMVRFIENHDEPRAADAFPDGKGRAAAVATFTLPGAKLLHQGQIEGRTVRLPVFLARRPAEPDSLELVAFYRRLLSIIQNNAFRNGDWQRCEISGWPDNQSCRNLLSWCWAKQDERWLIVVNLASQPAQARVHVPWNELPDNEWRLDDIMAGAAYTRSGREMHDAGLYVELGPWQYHLFRVSLVLRKAGNDSSYSDSSLESRHRPSLVA